MSNNNDPHGGLRSLKKAQSWCSPGPSCLVILAWLSSSWKHTRLPPIPDPMSMLSCTCELAHFCPYWAAHVSLLLPLCSPVRLARGIPCRAAHLSLLLVCLGATSTSACRAAARTGPPSGAEAQQGGARGCQQSPPSSDMACSVWAWHTSCMHCSSTCPSFAAGCLRLLCLPLRTLIQCGSCVGSGLWCLPQPCLNTDEGIALLHLLPLAFLTATRREALSMCPV